MLKLTLGMWRCGLFGVIGIRTRGRYGAGDWLVQCSVSLDWRLVVLVMLAPVVIGVFWC